MVSELRTESQPGRHLMVLQLPSDLGLKGTSTATIIQGEQGPALYINGRAIDGGVPLGSKVGDRVQVTLRPDGSVVVSPLPSRAGELEAAVRMLASLRAVLPQRPVALPERVLQQPIVSTHDLAIKSSTHELREAVLKLLQTPLREGELGRTLHAIFARGGSEIDAIVRELHLKLAPQQAAPPHESVYHKIDPLLRLLRAVPNSTGASGGLPTEVAGLLLDSHLNFSLEQVERVRDILRSIGDDQAVQVLLKLVSALDRILVDPSTESERELLRFLKELRNFLESKPQGEVLRRVLQSYLDKVIDTFVAPTGSAKFADLSPRFARALLVVTTNLETAMQQLGALPTPNAVLQVPAVHELLAMAPQTATEERVQVSLRALMERIKDGAPLRQTITRFLDEQLPSKYVQAEQKASFVGVVLQQALTEELQRLGGSTSETALFELNGISIPQALRSYQRMGPPQIAELLKDYAVRHVLSLVADRQLSAISEEPLQEAFVQFLEHAARSLQGRTTEHPKDERSVIRQGLERLKEQFLEDRRTVPLVKEVREDQRMLQMLESAAQAQELLARMLPMLPLNASGQREGVLLLPLFAFGMLQLVQVHHGRLIKVKRGDGAGEEQQSDQGVDEHIQFEFELAMLGRVAVTLWWRPGMVRGRFTVSSETIKKFLGRRLVVLRQALLGCGVSQFDWSIWVKPATE